MTEASRAWLQKTFGKPLKRISSLELQSGHTRSGSPASLTISPSGRAPVRVNRSPKQEQEKDSTTSGISGPIGSGSSKNATLHSFLVNRFRALTASVGSTLFTLTLKERITPSGRAIFAVRASERRTDDTASTSWPTPTSKDSAASGSRDYPSTETHHTGTTLTDAARLASWPTPCSQDGPNGGPSQGEDRLPGAAALSAWPTPQSRDGHGGGSMERTSSGRANLDDFAAGEGHTTGNPVRAFHNKGRLEDQVFLAGWATPTAVELGNTLESYLAMKANMRSGKRTAITHLSIQAQLSSWATPTTRDHKDGGSVGTAPTNALLGRQAWLASGETQSGSTAETASIGQLSPEHSRWLMGLPIEWTLAAPFKVKRASASSKRTATPSTRSKRRTSSEPSSISCNNPENFSQDNTHPATGEQDEDEMANPKRAALMQKLAKARASGVGNNFKDGKYRLAIKKMGFQDGFKGDRYQVEFVVMNAQKLAGLRSVKTGEPLDITPNAVGSTVDWMAVKLDDPESPGPGNVKKLILTLENDDNMPDEEYLDMLAYVSDVDEGGDPLPPADCTEPARGMVIDMETVRIETKKNKKEIVVCKWSHVPETEYDQKAVIAWMNSIAAYNAAQAQALPVGQTAAA
jgi:hypothetical protein